MLDVMLALNGVLNCLEFLKIHEPLQSILPCKTFDEARSMFEHAADNIVRHANIEDAVRFVGMK